MAEPVFSRVLCMLMLVFCLVTLTGLAVAAPTEPEQPSAPQALPLTAVVTDSSGAIWDHTPSPSPTALSTTEIISTGLKAQPEAAADAANASEEGQPLWALAAWVSLGVLLTFAYLLRSRTW